MATRRAKTAQQKHERRFKYQLQLSELRRKLARERDPRERKAIEWDIEYLESCLAKLKRSSK